MLNRILTVANLLLIALVTTAWAADPIKEENNVREQKPGTTSMLLRVRRVTIEDAYVAVPATEAIIKRQDDGTFRIEPKLFLAEAIRISKDKRTEWKIESIDIEPHQTQQPVPKDRKVFDAIVDLKK